MSPCGVHLNLQKIPKQCRVREKVVICDNVIWLVYCTCPQPIHNLVSCGVFNILMTCTSIHFQFLHKLGFGISQTLDFHSIATRFNFQIFLGGWVFPSICDHYFIHTQILFYILELTTQLITGLNYPFSLYNFVISMMVSMHCRLTWWCVLQKEFEI